MATIIPVTQESMRFMALLEASIDNMRSKDNPRFNIAIDKQKAWKKEVLKKIVDNKLAS